MGRKHQPYHSLDQWNPPSFTEDELPFFQRACNETLDAKGFEHYIGDRKEIRVANFSELWFILLLEKFAIKWEYEPDTFEFEREDNDKQIEGPPAFCPDTYLPEQNIYVELTLKARKYHVHKRRKIRRLHKVFPDVVVSLVGREEFLNLGAMEKMINRPALLAWLEYHIQTKED